MSSNPEKLSIPQLLESAAELPVSPKIFALLSELSQNQDTSVETIAAIVKMDPSLTASILKITNSAFYGRSFRANDIQSAIARIGFEDVRKALSVCVARDFLFQSLSCYGITAIDFAERSLAVAVASETLAKRAGADANSAYVSGLLHSIGKLAINLYLEKQGSGVELAALARVKEQSLEDIERDLLGITSWEAGAKLLLYWHFAPEIWQPIRQQPSIETASSYVLPTALLAVSIWIARQLKPLSPQGQFPVYLPWAFDKLSLPLRERELLVDEIRNECHYRRTMLEAIA